MILYSKWLALPLATRHKLAEQFNITKTGYTQVNSNVVTHDGYDVHDIESAMTVPAMQIYLDSDDDNVNLLFTLTVDKVEGRDVMPLELPAELGNAMAAMEPAVPVTPKPKGRVKGTKNKPKDA